MTACAVLALVHVRTAAGVEVAVDWAVSTVVGKIAGATLAVAFTQPTWICNGWLSLWEAVRRVIVVAGVRGQVGLAHWRLARGWDELEADATCATIVALTG